MCNISTMAYNSTNRGLVSTGSRGAGPRARRGPPDFQNPKKLSHKNAIKLEFSEKWGKIGLLAPPLTFGAREAPELMLNSFNSC